MPPCWGVPETRTRCVKSNWQRYARQRGGHRFDHRQIVRHSRKMGKEGADPMSAFSVLFKVPLRLQDSTNVIKLSSFQFAYGCTGVLPIVFFQNGFVIKSIHMGGAPSMYKKITLFALGGKCGGLGAIGSILSLPRPSAERAERATAPNPLAHHFNISRRLVGRLRKFWQCMLVSSFYWILGKLENYFKWKLKKPKRLWMDGFEKKGS